MSVQNLKSALKQLGAKTTGTKQQLENRLKTWEEHGLDKSLIEVKVVKVISSEEFPDNSLFTALILHSGLKVINYEAIQKWFAVRSANKGLERGRILAMKLFVKYTKIFINGENFYIQGSCCAEQKKTLDYKLKMKIIKSKSAFDVVQCNCSCPAGKGWSAACKHVGAFCFSLEHFSITGKTQEYVSCTSQPVSWNKPSEGRGIDVMSVFDITGQQDRNYNINEVLTNALVNNVINSNLSCPLTNSRKANLTAYSNDHSGLHMGAERIENQIDGEVVQETNSVEMVIDELQPNDSYNISLYNSIRARLSSGLNVQLPLIKNLTPLEVQYFNKNVNVSMEEALYIANATVHQNNELWKNQRRLRITASRCYELFTYCENTRPDWEKKITNFIYSKFRGNMYTDYGNTYEPVARQSYENQYGKVHLTGLLINPSFPWLSFSPDGLKICSGIIYKIVEFKCPILGKTATLENFVTTLPYVKYDSKKVFPYYLNPKHKYYGQVQLGMFILNLEMCDFCIYSSFENRLLVIEVPRDDVFIKGLICKLHYVYFKFYLKILVANA